MKKYILLIGALFFLLVLGSWLLMSQRNEDSSKINNPVSAERRLECERHLTLAIFPSGEAADNFMRACLSGEPVLPSDSPDTLPPSSESPDTQNSTSDSRVGEGCMIGGCSSQVCGEVGSQNDMITTCEYRNEYACYTLTRCEKQSSGQCGWTETAEYQQCFSSAKDETLVVY